MPQRLATIVRCVILLCSAVWISPADAADAPWITESNRYAQLLTEIIAKYNPETASSIGVAGHDAEVIDLKPHNSERQEADLAAATGRLTVLRRSVSDPRVRQDLDILLRSAVDNRHSLALHRQLMVPFVDLPQTLFVGFQPLLHEGIARDRQTQALIRLRRYAGAEPGYTPIAVLARARIAQALADPRLVAPSTAEIQESLDNQAQEIDGIRDLFQKSGLTGWQTDLATLTGQLDDYRRWITSTLLPKARKSSLLPEVIYADTLKGYGVDEDPRVLMQRALSAYSQIREQMVALAAIIAARHGYASAAYPDVIRELKKQTIPRERLLDVYQDRLAKLEDIVRDQHLATLPERAPVIRLASEAESAANPVPYVNYPRLVGNTGQSAEYVVPTSAALDDFSFDAVTWTLTAKDVLPGHEMQLARILEHGVSTARVQFAFNVANVEGWATYSEGVVEPYFPLDAQLASLQFRLLRTARAFLDPMVNLGLLEPDAARRILVQDICLSEPTAKHEVNRYLFVSPGQATAYFYGDQLLEATRAKAEIALGDRFNLQSYHDFILAQGLLPLDAIDKAVMNEYVPSHR